VPGRFDRRGGTPELGSMEVKTIGEGVKERERAGLGQPKGGGRKRR